MNIPEGKRKDIELMEKAIDKFNEKSKNKFLKGIEEHNSDGNNGMHKMTKDQTIEAIQEEIIDLWFYLQSLETKN